MVKSYWTTWCLLMIFVFCPSVPKCTWVAKYTRCVSGLCRIAWNYFQLQQNCLYNVWDQDHRKHTHPVADTGCRKSKICFPLQIFGDCIRYWVFRGQRHSETTILSILCGKQAASFFTDVRTQWKMHFFVSSLRSCTCHNHGVIGHTSTDCVWPITLFAELCTTCRGEWVFPVVRFSVTFFPSFEVLLRKKFIPVSWNKSNNAWLRVLMKSDCLLYPVACRGLVMPGPTACLDAPLPISGIEQWRMVVIVTGYTLFVASQYDVIFTFATNVLAKFVDTTCIFRDVGSTVGQGSSKTVEGNGNL